MSLNVQLHTSHTPYLVSPYESYFFIIQHTKLTVESGNGYPGQGGCFYGQKGRCFVSQYRVVFVSDVEGHTAYRSFSLPFYAIRDWAFRAGVFGGQSWTGQVNQVPDGGLVGVGRFTLKFLDLGFDEFRRHVEPVLEASRPLHQRFREMSTPAVLQVPAKMEDGNESKFAYYSPDDPFTLYVPPQGGS